MSDAGVASCISYAKMTVFTVRRPVAGGNYAVTA